MSALPNMTKKATYYDFLRMKKCYASIKIVYVLNKFLFNYKFIPKLV